MQLVQNDTVEQVLHGGWHAMHVDVLASGYVMFGQMTEQTPLYRYVEA